MFSSIFNNLYSYNAQRNLSNNSSLLDQSLSRIASGLRVQTSADDGASKSLADALNSDVVALQQGNRNLSDGVSLIKTADAGLGEVSAMLIRLRGLATQTANGTIDQNQRATLQLEYTALNSEIDRFAATTEFNGQKLLDGSLSSTSGTPTVIQFGDQTNSNNYFNLNHVMDLTAVTTSSLGIAGSSIMDSTRSQNAMTVLTKAVATLSSIRGRIGAAENRMTHTASTQGISVQSLNQAVSTTRDADLAQEFATLTRNKIITQASTAMVGQANLVPQNIMRLLRQ